MSSSQQDFSMYLQLYPRLQLFQQHYIIYNRAAPSPKLNIIATPANIGTPPKPATVMGEAPLLDEALLAALEPVAEAPLDPLP